VKSRLVNPLTKMKVKYQLILLFLVMVGPIFLLHAYGNTKAEQILKRHVTNAYIELNKMNVMLIDRNIESVNKITTTVIQNPITQRLVPDARDSVITRVNQYDEMVKLLASYSLGQNGGSNVNYSLYVYDPEDLYFFAPKFQYTLSGVYFFSDQDEPPWFQEAVQKKGKGYMRIVDVTEMLQPRKTLAYVRAVNMVTNGKKVIGVLTATQMDHEIGASLQSISLPGGEIYYLNRENTVLASTVPSQFGHVIHVPEPTAETFDASEHTYHFIDDQFIYVAKISDTLGQKLLYKVPVNLLLQQQSELKQVIQYMSITYTVVVCIFMMYFWRSIMMPLQKLAIFVRRYEPGKLIPSTPFRERKDEVGVLVHAMYEMANRLNTLITYKYQMEIKQKEAQLQILYQQINPHLLYNTLESIYWKCTMEGNAESAEMIKELSKLMKIGLSRGRELIRFEEELEHVAAYIRLQQKRYDDQFQVHWDIEPGLAHHLIPKITLQPLVENAMIHGVRQMEEDGEIMIIARAKEDHVEILVEDNGYKAVDFDAITRLLTAEESNPKLGFGIRNIHQRIQLHFGAAYGIHYSAREGGGTTVTIRIPLTPVETDGSIDKQA